MKKLFLRLLLFSVLLFAVQAVLAQEHSNAAPENASQATQSQPDSHPESTSEALVHEGQEAVGEHGAAEEDPHAEFKESASVKFVARITGLNLKTAYWLLVVINFAIIVGFIGWALKKSLPGLFRSRTEGIRKSMDEARKASEEANSRLSDIETRLARLDSEIADIRRAAEADVAAEESRIRAAAEEDRRKIVEMTEQEIEAAARAARRELKAYTAELAVSLAEKKIKVDPKTDEALLQAFVQQLGKGGR